MNFYKVVRPIYARAGKMMADENAAYIGNNSKILDLGCGSGIISREFEKKFEAVLVGADIVDLRIVPIEFNIFDGLNLPYADGEFDIVLLAYVLHHASEPVRILSEAKRVLKKGGKIIIYEDLFEGLAKPLCRIHGKTFRNLFDGNNGATGVNFKNRREWMLIFDHMKLKIVFEKRVALVLNPFLNKRLFILEK